MKTFRSHIDEAHLEEISLSDVKKTVSGQTPTRLKRKEALIKLRKELERMKKRAGPESQLGYRPTTNRRSG